MYIEENFELASLKKRAEFFLTLPPKPLTLPDLPQPRTPPVIWDFLIFNVAPHLILTHPPSIEAL
jgi:hypothetical protein